MSKIQIITTLDVPPENLDEFKRLSTEAVAVTMGDEGTLSYDLFFSGDGATCVMTHAHTSSDAVLRHMGNMGELLGSMVEIAGDIEVTVLGEPSAELLEATAAFGPKVHTHFAGK